MWQKLQQEVAASLTHHEFLELISLVRRSTNVKATFWCLSPSFVLIPLCILPLWDCGDPGAPILHLFEYPGLEKLLFLGLFYKKITFLGLFYKKKLGSDKLGLVTDSKGRKYL